MISIITVDSPQEKSEICNAVLRALPDWFGIESSVVEYTRNVQPLPFWAALDAGRPVGFVALLAHNAYTAEVFVTGILPGYHRRGIGRRLIACCEDFCRERQMTYLTVKTLDESREDSYYEKTRRFYFAMGFRPLEVFPMHWDDANPCLFMAKYLSAKPES